MSFENYPSVTSTGEDHSVAWTCLLTLEWFAKADSLDTPPVTGKLVEIWRREVAEKTLPQGIGCYELMRMHATELKAILDAAVTARAGS